MSVQENLGNIPAPQEVYDPFALENRRDELFRTYMANRHFIPDNTKTEEENSKAAQEHKLYLAGLIREQIAIIAKLRQTQTGPSANANKTRRGKRVPIDIHAISAAILQETKS